MALASPASMAGHAASGAARRRAHVARPATMPASGRPARTACSRTGRGKLVVVASSQQDTTQTKDKQQAAEGRWQKQVTDGSVKSVSARQAGELMQEGWVLLDVRPPTEIERVPIEGAVQVPLFVPDTGSSLGSLLAQASAFGTGGWWLGGTHMVPYPSFMQEVLAKVPKDAKVVVGCQRGLRSLAACEQLSRSGYGTLAWVNGGFDMAQKGDLPTPGNKDLRYAGIGGLSEALGWTEVQQQDSKDRGFFGGAENIFKVVAVVLLADAAVFAWEYIAFLQGKPNPFPGLFD